MNQIGIPDYQYYLGCNVKRIVCLTFLEKSSIFNRKYPLIRLLFSFSSFKSIEISSVQGVVQIKPNSVWSIPRVYRTLEKRISGIACLGKKLVFHSEICCYFK